MSLLGGPLLLERLGTLLRGWRFECTILFLVELPREVHPDDACHAYLNQGLGIIDLWNVLRSSAFLCPGRVVPHLFAWRRER
jgi:hypothetical protein